MAVPLQLRILRAIRTRLESIQIAGGYLTDAGETVLTGGRQVERKDCPAVVVIDGGDSASDNTGSHKSMTVTQVIYVDCFVAAYQGDDEAGEAITELTADAKQAALKYDAPQLTDDDGAIGGALVYIGRTPIEAQDGIEAQRIELNLTLKEGYGNPYQAS